MAPFDAAAPSSPISTASADFKEVLANLASGVAIISCWDGETPKGLLVSSITGLSVDPPRFLFCVRKEAGSHDALLRRPAISVALLGADDEEEALRFSSTSRAAERFATDRWDLSSSAPPTYRGGLAVARCRVDNVADAGTHSIFVVTAFHSALTSGAPLVVWNRSFLPRPSSQAH